MSGGLELRVEGDRLSFYRDEALVNEYRLTLDAGRYDLVGSGGGASDGRRYHGIYRISGDELETASRDAGRPRPGRFDEPEAFRESYRRKGR